MITEDSGQKKQAHETGGMSGKKAAVLTLGCKVNDVESGSLIAGLKTLGYDVTNEHAYADLYIINTCAVTAEAERKSRQAVGRALKDNPNAKVIVCGCASEKSPEDFAEKEGVFCVFGAKSKQRVLDVVKSGFSAECAALGHESDAENGGKTADVYDEAIRPESMKTRNFVKIQDGCNRFCSYCVIPYLRGRSRSRSLESAATEINESTAYETVITGIDVSDYRDGDRDISDLLYAVKNADTRIRFGSIEESMITPRFLEAAKALKHFAPQFHLSLQSGSTAVLKSMNRKYTREQYLEKCRMIYEAFPDAAITTDIIVGFPGETEEMHQETLALLKEVRFDSAYTFIYSPRTGTPAARMEDQIDSDTKHRRLQELMDVENEISLELNKEMEGKTYSIIVEGPSKQDPMNWYGRTSGNKMILFPYKEGISVGDTVDVKVDTAQTWVLKGELI